nr:Transcriptional regulator ATRX [Hymenolepis microstoma]
MAEYKEKAKKSNSFPVDLDNVNQSIWILKVPNYLVDIWNREVAKCDRMESLYVGDCVECIQIKEGGETEKNNYFISDEDLIRKVGEKESPIPHVYAFENASKKPPRGVGSPLESNVKPSFKESKQKHFVLGEADTIQSDDTKPQYSVVGSVKRKYNLHPIGLDQASIYSVKKGIEIEREKGRKIIRLDESDIPKEVVQSKANIEVLKKGGKRTSFPCPEAINTVLKAFEDNFRISQQDLLKITQLPKGALLKALEQVANRNVGSKKCIFWELKPEKSVATKLTIHPDFISTELAGIPVTNDVPSSEQTPHISKVETKNKEQSNENVIISTDISGKMTLPDGTPVVQPADVEDATDYSLQFDLQDGVLPRRPFSNSFQIGSIDTVRCTSCAFRISPFACTVHPHLSVILCKKCLKFYGKGEFAKDADGKDENCRWCGDGGDLICCDSCSNTFCKSCIKRNLGRTFLQNIEDLPDDASWYCLICNPSPLVSLQRECAEVFDRVKALAEQARKRSEMKRNRPVVQAPSKTTQVPTIQDPATKPNNQSSPYIATVVNMEFPEPRVTISVKGKTAPVTCNSVDFYLKNASISGILDQISTITPENFKEVIRSIRFCMETFSNDIRRTETSFMKATNAEEIQTTVRTFQSIFRYHLLNRLANVVLRVNEESAKKSASVKSTPTLSETIDLTDDLETTDVTNGNSSQTSSSISSTKRKMSDLTASSSTTSLTQVKRLKTLQVSTGRQNGEHSQPSSVNNEVVEKLTSVPVVAAKSINGSDTAVLSPNATTSNLWDSSKENAQGIYASCWKKMPFRLKRQRNSDDGRTSISNTNSTSAKRRKTSVSSRQSENSARSWSASRTLRSRRNVSDKESITISSDSESRVSEEVQEPTEGINDAVINDEQEDQEPITYQDDEDVVTIHSDSPAVKSADEQQSSSVRPLDSVDSSVTSADAKPDKKHKGGKTKRAIYKPTLSSNSDDESLSEADKKLIIQEAKRQASKSAANEPSSSSRRRKIFYSDDEDGMKEENDKEAEGDDGDTKDGSDAELRPKVNARDNGVSIKRRLRRRRKRSSRFPSSSSSSRGSLSSSSDIEIRVSDDEDKPFRKNGRKEPVGKEGAVQEEKSKKSGSFDGEGGGDEEDDADGKRGRRKIRKILKDKKLSSETKNAEALEKERRKRLDERQKLYNSVFEDPTEGSSAKNARLILDFKKDTEEAVVEVHPELVKHLKPHQIQAVRFLYDNIIESLDEHKENRNRLSGAILAHCMGLGKTLSTITFIHTLLTHKDVGLGIKTCLIICPVNTLLNWLREWQHWMPKDADVNVFELATANANNFRAEIIRRWQNEGGVMLMGYDMYRNLTTSLLKKTRKMSLKKLIPSALIDPGPGIVVCDEGHLLKNSKTGVTKAINSLKTPKRIILTGTPLQNNLSEYWTMVNFVKPNLLGSAREFANRFVNPIKNGQHSNSTQRDVQLMKKRAHVLFKTLDGCVQRRDYSCLTKYLPPRLEYVLKIRLCDVQRELYRAFLQTRADRGLTTGDDQKSTLFRDQQTLYRVWTHPFTLKMHETREARRAFLEESTSEEELDDEDEDEGGSSGSDFDSDPESSESAASTPAEVPTESSRSTRATRRQLRGSASAMELSGPSGGLVTGDGNYSASSGTVHIDGTGDRANGGLGDDRFTEDDILKPWWRPLYKNDYDLSIDVGAKLSALFFILKKCSEIGDKVLVFSQSLFSLDLIEWFLAAVDRQWCMSQGLEIDTNSKQSQELDLLYSSEAFEMPSLVQYFSDMERNTWRRGHDYERIDGSLSAVQRNTLQTRFNGTSQRFRLLIISTKAGGLGVNLTAANRLIIFDVSWNPSHDIQSIFRSYRFGQTKPVYIYRMVAQGTMEEKIYDRQVTKQSLALRVIDEQQVERHFKEEDLRELYTFEPDMWDPELAASRPPLSYPKDRLLADLISEQPHLVVSYHDHDSLLENRIDEGLSEAERAEAWREYEEEKRVGRPMTEFQRFMLNNPQAALAHRQRLEEEQRRMAAMAAMHYNAAAAATIGGSGGRGGGNRLPYASINPSPQGIDSMFTTLPTSAVNYAQRPPMPQQQRDTLSESYNAVQNMLLSRFPMLARAPGALHDMSVRLFLNNVANTIAAQNTQPGLAHQPQQSDLTSLMTNPRQPVPSHFSTSLPQPNFPNLNIAATGDSGDVINSNNNVNRLASPMIVDVDNESPVEDA